MEKTRIIFGSDKDKVRSITSEDSHDGAISDAAHHHGGLQHAWHEPDEESDAVTEEAEQSGEQFGSERLLHRLQLVQPAQCTSGAVKISRNCFFPKLLFFSNQERFWKPSIKQYC